MSNTKLIWITPEAEKVIMYCARVSSDHQDSSDTRLLKYCINHGHWSVFEQACMCVEIETTRDISAQIIRHRSFSFQEFSQRYAKAQSIEIPKARRQDKKNRQNSIDNITDRDQHWFITRFSDLVSEIQEFYTDCLDKDIAKECARKILPMNTHTKIYMTGTIRSFIHYLALRDDKATQLEHRQIAVKISNILAKECPIIYNAVMELKKD